MSEDINFCRRAISHGYEIHVDTEAWMTHLTTCAVRLYYDDEHQAWLTGFDIGDGAKLAIPFVTPEMNEELREA